MGRIVYSGMVLTGPFFSLDDSVAPPTTTTVGTTPRFWAEGPRLTCCPVVPT